MPPAVRTSNLRKSFGNREVLRGLTMTVPTGAAYGFLGANGAGKTTTVDILTTLSRQTAGEAQVAGHDVLGAPNEVRKAIGVVTNSDQATLPHWDAIRFVSFFASLHGIAYEDAADRAREAFSHLGLRERDILRPIGDYSSGMRRKVDLVRALLHEPQILFLDEPTRQLDIVARTEFWRILRQVHSEGITIFLTSHDPSEIAAVCTHTGVLIGGKLIYDGPLDEFTRGPVTAETVQRAMEESARHRAEFSVIARTGHLAEHP